MHQHQQQQQHQGDAAADEVRDEMVKIAMSSTGSIDGATMDRLFGTIAMIKKEKWRHLGSGNGSTTNTTSNATDHLRLSASLFARLRRLNQTHFDTIMVKWLKRLRMLRDRPAVAIIYPVFVVFGCLDLASLLATTADEQPREPGGPVQSPARNTWRTSYLQDVLALLTAPKADRGSGSSCNATLTCDENQRFRLFLSEAPFAAPAAIAALVRNAVAEMTQWRRQQNMTTAAGHHAAPRSSVDALAVSRLLRTAAVADATAAAHALAQTTDQAVRRGLWEMTTLALTRQVVPARPALDMLRELDIFAADMGQLALGLAADGLAGLILRAVAESQLPSLHVLHSLPSDMAVSLKEHAQARFLDLVPTRKQPLRDAQHVCVATGFLDVVRTIMLSQQLQQKRQKQRPRSQPPAPPPLLLSPAIQSAAGLPALDSAVVDKLGELWCLLQEHKTSTAAAMATRQSIIQDWLPALLSLVLLHLPSRGLTTADGLGPSLPRTSRDLDQETVSAGACIVLASLCIDIVPLADDPADGNSSGRLALQTRLFDTALLLADGLSDETRQSCVRTLRDVSASVAVPNTVGAGDLSPAMAYLLSSPASASIYYPRLYLERMPAMFGRPGPQQQQQSGTSSQPTTGAVRRLAGFAAPPERSRRVRFGLKTWDAVSDPSPAVQDNDTAVNLWLLEATKVVRQRRR
ncbi:hypothetical protein CMQ_8212 [Grosmannia clavigera kw1407]|uniref:Uncharacterized protein n=1 Tax=Grosmannia clavigera (strain kw1407 / UAMH 11150) TaxID=655863 RepID=F0XKH5_GROCL|nr:uncharacterized protein CMQ_8212 [Grosmannia clavigera kw1407]EFX01746.1 hypothetical protein CMQ_8212 [Grosmannia clavigera kw1407]